LDIWHLLAESWSADWKPFLNISNEVRNADAECIGQNLQGPNGNVAFPALQFPYVRAIQSTQVSEFILRQRLGQPEFSDSGTYPTPHFQFLHLRIVWVYSGQFHTGHVLQAQSDGERRVSDCCVAIQ
jgi:hypothetical protein